MTLLVIGIGIVTAWLVGRHLQGLKHAIMHGWFALLLPRQRTRWWPWLLVVTPGAAVAVAQWALVSRGHLLGVLVLAIVAFVFAWGSRDLDADVAGYLNADGPKARRQAGEPLVFSYRLPETAVTTGHVIEGVFYQALIRWFGTIFWFVALGAGGVVAFRFAHALLSERDNRELMDERQLGVVNRGVALINWPPAVLATLALAVVGDFDRVLSGTRQRLKDGFWRRFDCSVWPGVGREVVESGHSLDDAFSHDFSGKLGQVNAAMSLVWRVLVCWLTVISLISLAIWFR